MLYPTIGLNNILIGGPENHQVAIGFRAKFSSPLAGVRFYTINQNHADTRPPGYAGGSGGRMKYEIWDDGGGKPGRPLAGGVPSLDPQYTMYVNVGGFPLVVFPTFPVLTSGKWYYFVITNIDADPVHNYISADFLISKTGTNPDPDSKVLYSTNGIWTVYGSLMASPFGAFYANGELQGNGGYQMAGDGSTMCGKAYGFGKLC